MFIPKEKKMYCYVNLMIILTLYVPLIYSQADIITLTKVPYYCENKLSLKCKLSSSCCNVLTRSWRKDGSEIISNGAETASSGKYSETVVDAENYFILTINDLKDDDFGKEYICLYGGHTSAEFKLKESDLLCSPCGICIAICLACALGGMTGFCLLEYAILLCSSLLTKLPCYNNCSVSYKEVDSHYILCGKDYVISKKKKSLLIAILVNAVGLILYGLIPGLCFGWFCYICYVELAPLLLLFALGALLFIVIFYWTLEFHSDENFSIWRYLGYVALTFLILPLIVLVPYYMCCKANSPKKEDSKELGTLNQ